MVDSSMEHGDIVQFIEVCEVTLDGVHVFNSLL